MAHITVLKKEAVEALTLNENSVVFDCTIGAGGHSAEIIKHLGKDGVYVGFDVDITALENLTLPKTVATIHLVNRNFRELGEVAAELSLIPTAILADLGWRSEQFESGKKGFSFTSDEPLHMTYGESSSYDFTASTIVNEWEEQSLIDIIAGYGEDRSAKRIATAIVKAREEEEIKTAKQLADIIYEAVPSFRRRQKIHPATKTFQALRIAVNDELGALKSLLDSGFESLAPGGRMAVISFHSLEDRIVKRFFRELAHDLSGKIITKRPIVASEQELSSNPRARSAKLRIIEKV